MTPPGNTVEIIHNSTENQQGKELLNLFCAIYYSSHHSFNQRAVYIIRYVT